MARDDKPTILSGGFLTKGSPWGLRAVLAIALALMLYSGITRAGDTANEPPPWAGQTPSADNIVGRGASELVAEPGLGEGQVRRHDTDTPASEDPRCENASSTVESATEPPDAVAPVPGAELIGGQGYRVASAIPPSRAMCLTLTDFDLREARQVAVDGQGGIWLHWVGPGPPSRQFGGQDSTVLRTHDGAVDLIREFDEAGWLTTLPGGDVVTVTRGEDTVSIRGRDAAGDHTITLSNDPASTKPEDNPLRGGIDALAAIDERTVLAARSRGVFAFEPDGSVRHVVGGFRGVDDAEIPVDGLKGNVESLVVLSDDRVAFLMTNAGDPHGSPLYLLDGDRVRALEVTAEDGREIEMIHAGPDGRLLAVNAGPRTHPQIQVIDADTSEARTVADLEGIMPHPDGARGVEGALWPVAAAADGADLVFLADGYLWRLPDAFDARG